MFHVFPRLPAASMRAASRPGKNLVWGELIVCIARPKKNARTKRALSY
jgi:hypothetical protein